jgi:vacuolar-type H+-ATPase subunit F/Vma7
MSRVAAIGDARRVAGFALAGVEVHVAETSVAAHDAWDELGVGVGLVILTPQAAADLERRLSEREDILWVTLPK